MSVGREAVLQPSESFDPASHAIPLDRARAFVFSSELSSGIEVAEAELRSAGGAPNRFQRMDPDFHSPSIGVQKAVDRLDRLKAEASTDMMARLRDGRLLMFGKPGTTGAPWRRIEPETANRLRRQGGGELWTGGGEKWWLPHVHECHGLPANLAMRLYGPPDLVNERASRVSWCPGSTLLDAVPADVGTTWDPYGPRKQTGQMLPALGRSFDPSPDGRLHDQHASDMRSHALARLLVWFDAELAAGKIIRAATEPEDRLPALFRLPRPPAGAIEGWPADAGELAIRSAQSSVPHPRRDYDREPLRHEFNEFRAENPKASRKVIQAHMQTWATQFYKDGGRLKENLPMPMPDWVRKLVTKLLTGNPTW